MPDPLLFEHHCDVLDFVDERLMPLIVHSFVESVGELSVLKYRCGDCGRESHVSEEIQHESHCVILQWAELKRISDNAQAETR